MQTCQIEAWQNYVCGCRCWCGHAGSAQRLDVPCRTGRIETRKSRGGRVRSGVRLVIECGDDDVAASPHLPPGDTGVVGRHVHRDRTLCVEMTRLSTIHAAFSVRQIRSAGGSEQALCVLQRHTAWKLRVNNESLRRVVRLRSGSVVARELRHMSNHIISRI